MNLPSDKSIAVLPFANISTDGQNEFFCDGITEEIIDALAKIEGLRVISRTSSFYYKNHKLPLKEIADSLGVAILLEGSVRLAGDTLRIRAQLTYADADEVFWSDSWDRNKHNLFEVQDEISLLIADKLREHLGHMSIDEHLVQSPTGNLSAYEHYLKGRFHILKWNPEDTNIAIEEFNEAVAIDHNLIDAYLGLADSYSFMAVAGFAPREESWMKAMDAIQTAKKLDPNNAGLNYMLGNQAFFTEADFAESMHYGLKSLASKPTYSEAHRFLSFLNTLHGDLKKAKEYILFAKSIDPINPETRFFEANYLYRAEMYEQAERILDELLKENSKNLPALIVSIYIQIMDNRLEEARSTIDNIPDELITPDERLGLLCIMDISSGKPDSPYLVELEQHASDPSAHHAHSYLFIVYARLAENDKAFQILENLFTSQSSILLLGFSDPLASPIRHDSRYSDYHARVYPEIEEKPKAPKTRSKAIDESEARLQAEKLRSFVTSERPYLNPSLTLRLLAHQTEIHPNQLSWLLNEFVGKNFNEFINHERIAHFKKLVVDPDNSHISLIGLAYESGFNSKTVFNTAFKKAEGMTPKEYQKSQQ
ncbi:MAG: helix-turn-helix domain-containing protein [Cyclobacteriaceae bacterium]